ncbi:UDP-N-acetylglucosamine--N-acetylmuramyl-(pentapeptide) pyrophosphoryl-undecaprenol N-acetylglucosamine transferase, partial [Candidatus Bipolaricaulota bacterium]|nr:UDP-N-acetylglucosamine--N-acetylmuramyl-(pentapeptide) pyrophosphoryl-undecaprenol N-acetylglucosamine transferase [Candidatus Bipolaricaulota bacterium]
GKQLNTDTVSLVDYVENMGDAYSLSDMVISRGGAGTMAELIEAREPALVIPWEGAAENHQFYNARYLEENGGALLVEEDEWLDLSLLDTLEEIFTTEGKLEEMSRSYLKSDRWSGAEGVIKVLKDIINEGE